MKISVKEASSLLGIREQALRIALQQKGSESRRYGLHYNKTAFRLEQQLKQSLGALCTTSTQSAWRNI